MHVMDAEGWFISSSADLSIHTGESYADRPWFSIPFEQGEIYFSPPIFFRTGGFLGTSVNVPITSDTGNRVGVLTRENSRGRFYFPSSQRNTFFL